MSAAPLSNIDVCKGCGRMFPRLRIQLCPLCAPNEELRFQLVRDYMKAHGDSGYTINEVADKTGVSRSEIARFFDDGRLVQATSNGLGTRCSCAGKGTCGYCRQQMAGRLDSLRSKMQEALESKEDEQRVRYVRRKYRTE